MRRRSSRSRCRPTRTTTPTWWPSPARLRPWRSRPSRSRRRWPACAVGYVDGAFVINPSYAQRKVSALDIVVAGSKDSLVMVEAGAKEVSEDVIVRALEAGTTPSSRLSG